MLMEERYTKILQILDERKAVTVTELASVLDSSESTVRRDLAALDEIGRLKKVHGGATSLGTSAFVSSENDVNYKKQQFSDEKQAIGIAAARLITSKDFIYIDAGTTTEALVDAITEKEAVYVTNGLIHAQKLMRKGMKTYVLEGRLREETEAIVGPEALHSLQKYHFTLGFFGANGIDYDEGFTTPDVGEALIKREAFERSQIAYVLTDASKFNQITPVTFGALEDGRIITNHLQDVRYKKKTEIMEVETNDLHSDF